MCGILGFYNLDLSIEKLLAQQKFRGPDSQGACEILLKKGGKLILGHNRLKIICLTDDANQPFIDPQYQHYLVFNGEIYNYLEIRQALSSQGIQTRTTSDTEVLLLALMTWGIEVVNTFNGMFAFAYFDSKQLYLVRDRFGVKPLYYYYENNKLLFSSTSALIAQACDLKPNYSYLQFGIQYGIYQDNTASTAYTQLNAVPAGHYVTFSLTDSGNKKVVEYYNLNARVQEQNSLIIGMNSKQMNQSVHEMLSSATALRLKADVPVAVSMSGGLDSSIIAGLAKQMNTDLVGFCFGDLKDRFSEASLAQKTADLNQIDLVFVDAKSEDWVEALFETIKYQDAPFCGLSVVAQFLLYKKIKTHGFKVVLGGQGGDESFLGYRKFQLIYLKELVKTNQYAMALSFMLGLSKMAWAERSNVNKFWQMRAKYTKSDGFGASLSLNPELSLSQGQIAQGIRSRQLADITANSLPTLLRYEDRNSMAHGIESRLPFMDYRLIELACALPINTLLKNGYGKAILRDTYTKSIPEEIRKARYKRGFDVSCNTQIMTELLTRLSSPMADIQKKLSGLVKLDLNLYNKLECFERNPQRFTELTTLLWLNVKC
ncbi:MAG: asparagine synthase (glutamine-hydrolyzing) [Legionella sp.]|nr:asparagine synthase (glutamine-hydrolyzing) [Legionella sp.]